MRDICDYCGRLNSDDGHGGCRSCGAPIKNDARSQRSDEWITGTACVYHSTNYTQIARKAVRVSDFTPPNYGAGSQVRRGDDSPSITFAPLTSTFTAPDTSFGGGDFSGGGGDFGGAGASGSWSDS